MDFTRVLKYNPHHDKSNGKFTTSSHGSSGDGQDHQKGYLDFPVGPEKKTVHTVHDITQSPAFGAVTSRTGMSNSAPVAAQAATVAAPNPNAHLENVITQADKDYSTIVNPDVSAPQYYANRMLSSGPSKEISSNFSEDDLSGMFAKAKNSYNDLKNSGAAAGSWQSFYAENVNKQIVDALGEKSKQVGKTLPPLK